VIVFRPKGLLGGREIDFNRFWSWLLPKRGEKAIVPGKEVS